MKKLLCLSSLHFISAVSTLAGIKTIPDPHVAFSEEETVVWSPLFQATWDTMNREMGGPPKRIDPPNAIMARMDVLPWKPEAVMPAGSWKTWGGTATPNFLKRVNTEAAQITGESEGPFNLDNFPPDSLACFGLLKRDVEFNKSFHRSKNHPILFGENKQPVRFFGASGVFSEGYSGFVRVLDYGLKTDSHALELLCKEADDRLILYLPPSRQDFHSAVTAIREFRIAQGVKPMGEAGSANDPWLHRGDDLRIPYVSFEVTSEMAGYFASDRYYGQSVVPWRITHAGQQTKFALHEKGARIQVETSIAAMPFGMPPKPPPTVPRKFIFDRPFYIFLWRDKADWPYLGVWVGDVSALQTMEK